MDLSEKRQERKRKGKGKEEKGGEGRKHPQNEFLVMALIV